MREDGFLAVTDELPLNIQVGDYITWKGETMRVSNDEGTEHLFVSAEMVGKVVMISKNPLARKLKAEGIPIKARPWALVEVENGMRMVINSTMAFEKVLTQ